MEINIRYTTASLMTIGGANVTTAASIILGHTQPSTVLGIYTHAFDKNKKLPVWSLKECWRYKTKWCRQNLCTKCLQASLNEVS